MDHRRRARWSPLVAAVALSASLGLAAGCAQGGGDAPAERSEAPAGSIDRRGGGVIVGPINRARDTADDAGERHRQLEQRTETGTG